MVRWFTKRTEKTGMAPGTLVPVLQEEPQRVRMTVMDYDEHQCTEREVATVEECFRFRDTPSVTWINIDGIHDVEIIEKIGTHFDIHPLILEDIVTTGQRPKVEEFEKYIYVVLKMLNYRGKNEMDATQVSFILGPNFVISFQEKPGDVFEPVRDRIRQARGRIRKLGPDHLLYSLIDAIVDNYFIIMEKQGEKVGALEEEVVGHPDPDVLNEIYSARGKALFVRKAVWPLREVIARLQRAEILVTESTVVYLRDVYDHTIQVIDTVETLQYMLASMIEVYVSSVSNRLNEVMKVLTIIATIFIPITWVASVYGMNFQYMPPIHEKWGFPVVMGLMLVSVGIMAIYFKRRKWF
jgi:magnesium transporter